MKIKRIIPVFLMILMITALTSAFTTNAATVTLKATVSASNVNVRSGAGSSYKVVKSGVPKGTTVTVLNNKFYNKSWYYVKLSGGTKGYIHKDYIKIKKNQLYINRTGTGFKGYTCAYKLTNTTTSPVTWTSSNEKKATVDSKGVITCLKSGTVNITATAGTKTVTSTLNILNADVKLSKTTAEIYHDDTLTLTATCKKPVTFESSDTSIATVDEKGVVTPKAVGTVKIKAKSNSGSATCEVTIKKRVITLTTAKTKLYKGCNAQVFASGGKYAYKYTSSNPNVLTVTDSGIIKAVGTGSAKITCTSGTISKKMKFTVVDGKTVGITKTSADIPREMTLYLKSSTSGVSWKSSNPDVASVDKGFVLGKKKGTAVISAYTSGGEATCLVTVSSPRPIRFTYSSENSVLPNKSVTLYAITDKSRTDVEFKVTDAQGKITWLTKTTKTLESGRYIWSGSFTPTTAGVTTIVAYSRTSGTASWKTCDGGECTILVNKGSSRKTMSTESRYASTALIKDIAYFEGYLPYVTPDTLASNIPTIGHGRVVYGGTLFYNGLTRKEAYAYLVGTINESGFTSQTNKFLTDNNIKFNQQQFDALVCFAYNLGSYYIPTHENVCNVFLNTYGKETNENRGYVNDYSVPLRKSADETSQNIKSLSAGTNVKLVDNTLYNKSWYKVKLNDGTKGYIQKSKVTLRTTNTKERSLNNVDVQDLADAFLPIHHSDGYCRYGLLYRRIDEVEMFAFGDYEVNGKQNNSGFKYSCKGNSGFKIS